MEVASDSLMREEEESTTAARNLEVSISFGRFENDLLSWEKWSSFSQNKYLEEVEKCATPGSVAAKKAYFEARNKLIAVRKAEVLNKQMEACRETNEEKDFQNTRAGEVDQYDEEVIEENVFGSEMSSPGLNEHPEVETNIFVPQEPNIKDVIKATSTDRLTNGESKLRSEMCSLGMNEQPDVNTNLFMSQEPDEKDAIEAVSTNETDQPASMLSFVSGCAQTNGEEQVGQPFEIGSKFEVYNDVTPNIKLESTVKIALSPTPSMLDHFKLDDAALTKSPLQTEDKYAKSKFVEDIPASKTDIMTCVGELPTISGVSNTQSVKVKPRMQNSSKKVFPANKQYSADNVNVKKTLVSRVPGSPQMLTPKTSKPLISTVKSASRSLPVSNVKRTPTSVPAVRKSDQVPKVPVSSMKQSSVSLSKNGSDLLTSRKKFISPVVSQKPTPRSLHMSLNFGSKVSSSVLGSASVTEPRKSLFLEKMGDKDIVKRAFRAFQYMSTPINIDTNATSKKVVRDKTDVTPLTKDRLLISKKSASIYTSGKLNHSKEDKRNEGACTGDRKQGLINKAATQPGLHKKHALSKSFQDKVAPKS